MLQSFLEASRRLLRLGEGKNNYALDIAHCKDRPYLVVWATSQPKNIIKFDI